MKVEIKENGHITITAETDAEAHALSLLTPKKSNPIPVKIDCGVLENDKAN